MRTFNRKGYGRIYVESEDQIQAVREAIRQMDEFEFSYLPSNLVTTFSEYPEVVYTHKFDSLDLDHLAAKLWMQGVKTLIVEGISQFDGFLPNPVEHVSKNP